jgi:hypothetical protein
LELRSKQIHRAIWGVAWCEAQQSCASLFFCLNLTLILFKSFFSLNLC